MPRYIAFLRAVNVGGRTIKMDQLRAVFESFPFTGVETFIASGNVIFQVRSTTTATLERRIEKKLHEAFGYEVATFLRTAAEVAAVARYQPFPAAAMKKALALSVGFIAAPLGSGARGGLEKLRTPIDEIHVNGREIYWMCRQRQSESMISNAAFEKALGIRVTFRGINTVARLAAKYPPSTA